VKAEREFEAQRNPYRPPVHAAVYRVYERPDAYLARVAAKTHYDGYVASRADCARLLASCAQLGGLISPHVEVGLIPHLCGGDDGRAPMMTARDRARAQVCGVAGESIMTGIKTWIAALAILMSTGTALAATIEIDGDGVRVTGELAVADFDTFRRMISGCLPKDTVITFDSPGGALSTGLKMGELIRMRGFSTFVRPNTTCSSSCALAWMAGLPRGAALTARIGFHAAYDAQGVEKGMANALVGAFYRELGLSWEAIGYLTKASPQGMQWLNFDDAEKLGIDVVRATDEDLAKLSKAQPCGQQALAPPPPAPAPEKQLPPHERPGMTLEKAMKEMAVWVREAWAKPSPDWNVLRRIYSDRVMFHENDMAVDDVMGSKRRFAEIWPLRSYKIRPDTVSAACQRPSNACDVRGIMDWHVSNPRRNKAMSGVDTFEYRIRWTGDRYEVLVETTTEISRQILPLQPPSETGTVPRAPRSLWNHNGSVVWLAADGVRRRFYYDKPRQGLRDEGVTPQTLLFEGIKSGTNYS
jgi:hypothetical protein